MPKASGQKPFFSTSIRGRRRLSDKAFEIELLRPDGLRWLPGQRIQLSWEGLEREYTPVSIPGGASLRLCVRRVPGGTFSTFLTEASVGTNLGLSGPFGYFLYQPSGHWPVFIATGTGVAPFVAMAASGVTGFTLLHGVSAPEELYYADRLRTAAGRYLPCVSRIPAGRFSDREIFPGRVTDFVRSLLTEGIYDFYLCGSGGMITEVISIVDERFPGSRVFSERFFG